MAVRAAHHYYDAQSGDTGAVTFLDSAVVGFDEGLSDFLSAVRRTSGRVPVLILSDSARITPAFDRLTEMAGALSLIRDGGGYRLMRGGLWAPRVADFLTQGPTSAPSISPRHLIRRPLVDVLYVSASLYHPAKASAMVGRSVELIAEAFAPAGEVSFSWGRYEPAGAAWDRAGITSLARRKMPAIDLTIALHGEGFTATGTMSVNRTRLGIEEYVELAIAVPGRGASEHEPRALALLRALSQETRPQFALVTRTKGFPDTSLPTSARVPASPVAILVGRAGLKQLGVNPSAVAEHHGGTVEGVGKRLNLVVPLTAAAPGDWAPLIQLIKTLDEEGTTTVARVLGHSDQAESAPGGPESRRTNPASGA
ncbi:MULTISPECIES: DUF6177 family protein [Actinomyces]|uniref:Uncharacterized protein n=1 Tax=Actinomyces marmotae TaxID=2737173 RepID=A0A6M8B694_9ACTO|nr:MULTISPECIES: DUF6177 family protein [Actinomyces]QKD78961.1 hypothetical protein HPC72_00600 [Actinomyces marmotae]